MRVNVQHPEPVEQLGDLAVALQRCLGLAVGQREVGRRPAGPEAGNPDRVQHCQLETFRQVRRGHLDATLPRLEPAEPGQ